MLQKEHMCRLIIRKSSIRIEDKRLGARTKTYHDDDSNKPKRLLQAAKKWQLFILCLLLA